MTAFTWIARGREVSGLSADPAGAAVILPWSADPSFVGSSLPWAAPEYPTFLIYQIGVTMTTSAVVATRRLSVTLSQAVLGSTEWTSSGLQAASLVRRWELGVGFALDTTLANASYREPLPRGFMLLPGLVGGPEAQMAVSVLNAQVGDVLGPLSVRGSLLFP